MASLFVKLGELTIAAWSVQLEVRFVVTERSCRWAGNAHCRVSHRRLTTFVVLRLEVALVASIILLLLRAPQQFNTFCGGIRWCVDSE